MSRFGNLLDNREVKSFFDCLKGGSAEITLKLIYEYRWN